MMGRMPMAAMARSSYPGKAARACAQTLSAPNLIDIVWISTAEG
jgi:hypothetical protein